MRLTLATALVLSLIAGACLDPDVGDLEVPFCTNNDRDTETDVSFSEEIVPLLVRSVGGCIMCHLPSSPSTVGITVGGLDLSTYDTLKAGGATSAGITVVPGAPCESVLYLKLTAAPPNGARMPANGPPYFTTEELNLVHDWIAEGGREN